MLVFLLAIALLILAARGCAGCATTALVSQIPSSVDATIGKVGGEAMRAQHGVGQTPSAEDQARAARVFEELRTHLTSEEAARLVSPRLTVLSDKQANAFALPGGEVFVLTGLLDRTKDDDDALRGVMAHELGHAVRRHGVRSLVRNSVYGLVLAYVLGDMGGITATLVAGASHLDELGFSRDMEEDADAFAVDLLQRAGHTPEGLARFMESLESAPVPQILSTHPDSADRAREIRARMQKPAP
ncbi:Peptidase M48, Ste24p [Chondromyces apiculatus DSM 436]|uniref:Peptidase M48, Ste24p n=1 Tax=Chondromyces apiculatus DSM 436 TaxID=1192034 RepID=A0A017TB02_9BACT|nr:Peptidase M48, Ste24p [Chondromyces apiculatus DSM 436]